MAQRSMPGIWLAPLVCAAALATIRKESNSWAWMGFTALFQLVVAWVVTFIVYQVGMLII